MFPFIADKEIITHAPPRFKSFNYAVGMFGTSIPINMLKTCSAIYYVDRLGLTTIQLSLILFVYTFIDALDNPIYGFLSDRINFGETEKIPADRGIELTGD